MKVGIIFPGQGTQFLGMGKEFYDRERIVQELFEQASNCLDQNFVRLCFASSESELRQTINAQTAIFLVGASIFDLLNKKYDIKPTIIAGHSCGEYTAIYAGGGINFSDALYLLKKRAAFMQKATLQNNGSMIAVVGANLEELQDICKKYDNAEDNKIVEIVNFNSPNQFVISGTLPELENVKSDLRELKVKTIPLKVAGAFHSRLMRDAEQEFEKFMLKVDLKDLQIPIVTNLEAKLISDSLDVKRSIIKQISRPVLWWQSMQKFKDLDLIISVGPGDKLAKIIKREWPEKNIHSVNTFEDMQNLLTVLEKKLKIDEDHERIDLFSKK
ncbi:ACP S-malonyltransferase [Candidatus Dependentiae bacterium]